jgi:hypothetical protein
MSDYILNLIEALRVKGHDLPDGFATAPILDNWEFKACVDGYAAPSEKCRRALILVGRISGGDDRFPAGHIIHTSEVREVDGRPSIRWVRTRNTLYRLGAPALSVPLVTAAALAPDWTEALALLALMSGERILAYREANPRH